MQHSNGSFLTQSMVTSTMTDYTNKYKLKNTALCVTWFAPRFYISLSLFYCIEHPSKLPQASLGLSLRLGDPCCQVSEKWDGVELLFLHVRSLLALASSENKV